MDGMASAATADLRLMEDIGGLISNSSGGGAASAAEVLLRRTVHSHGLFSEMRSPIKYQRSQKGGGKCSGTIGKDSFSISSH